MLKYGTNVVRLSYTAVTAYKFPRTGNVALFTGSSLNRSRKKNISDEQKEQNKRVKEAKAAVKQNSNRMDKQMGAVALHKLLHDKKYQSGIVPVGKTIGRKAKDAIRDKGTAMYRAGRCKTIVTLSFIASVTDNVAIRCLQNFVRMWRKDFGQNINYLWVAERQQNGNVHFHILTSKVHDIVKMNNRWVITQYNQGLKFVTDMGETVERWQINSLIKEGLLNKFLNPFDTKFIYSQFGILTYVTKYITKMNKSKPDENCRHGFDFRPWRSSLRVSRVFRGLAVQKETMKIAQGEQNRRVQTKDYFDKETGEIKYQAGYIHYPLPYVGLWASKIALYNPALSCGQFSDLDKMNKKILEMDFKPDIERITELNYYNAYCRDYTKTCLELSVQHYENKYRDQDEIFYIDNGYIKSRSFDGRLPEPGRYKLKSGKYYNVGRFEFADN